MLDTANSISKRWVDDLLELFIWWVVVWTIKLKMHAGLCQLRFQKVGATDTCQHQSRQSCTVTYVRSETSIVEHFTKWGISMSQRDLGRELNSMVCRQRYNH